MKRSCQAAARLRAQALIPRPCFAVAQRQPRSRSLSTPSSGLVTVLASSSGPGRGVGRGGARCGVGGAGPRGGLNPLLGPGPRLLTLPGPSGVRALGLQGEKTNPKRPRRRGCQLETGILVRRVSGARGQGEAAEGSCREGSAHQVKPDESRPRGLRREVPASRPGRRQEPSQKVPLKSQQPQGPSRWRQLSKHRTDFSFSREH